MIRRFILPNLRQICFGKCFHMMASSNYILKTPKGMRDIQPVQERQRKRIIRLITECFERHGAEPLDTPVCERKEILTGKYGEESKLIYNLEDQGGEALSLRYDLTVPFARYLGMNKIQSMTRYQIAKVYRRDNPSIIKGRFREFYQCDIDFAGEFDCMMADAECLQILCEILDCIQLPYEFSIKINHRKILNGMFKVSGVPQDKFKTICSSVDKLDKMSWDEVKNEMCNEKGLDPQVADTIGSYVSKSGGLPLVEEMLSSELAKDDEALKGLEEMKKLYSYAEYMNITKYLSFDLSLARGLDYYTGPIFEAVLKGDVEVGSVAAGGRYDNLVSSILDNQNFSVPCCGLSVGIERLFAIIESQPPKLDQLSDCPIHCCVGSIGKVLDHRFRIIDILRKKGFRVMNVRKDSVKPLVLYQTCEKYNVPYAIFFGAKDLENNVVCVRTLSTREEVKVPTNELADHLAKLFNFDPQVRQLQEKIVDLKRKLDELHVKQ